MKIIGLDEKEYTWIPSNNIIDTKRSSLHEKASILLKERFPFNNILEEVVLPGTKTKLRNTTLKADFFIPAKKLIVEVHGEQHFKYNTFFFENKMQFLKAQARDRDKKEWCELNDFNLIELIYSESIEEWKKKIQQF